MEHEPETALNAFPSGRPAAELLPEIYTILKRMATRTLASESPAHTLQPTALVHEAFIRLSATGRTFGGRGSFLTAAAEAMRRVLVDHARRKRRHRRGAGRTRVALDDSVTWADEADTQLFLVDSTLEALASHDPRAAAVARLHVFVGLSVEEVAHELGLSPRTAFRDWAYARAWMARHYQTEERQH